MAKFAPPLRRHTRATKLSNHENRTTHHEFARGAFPSLEDQPRPRDRALTQFRHWILHLQQHEPSPLSRPTSDFRLPNKKAAQDQP